MCHSHMLSYIQRRKKQFEKGKGEECGDRNNRAKGGMRFLIKFGPRIAKRRWILFSFSDFSKFDFDIDAIAVLHLCAALYRVKKLIKND